MRIATITFHWATNYGAVLQSYALQKFLINNGYETEIINYVPNKMNIRQYIDSFKNREFHFIRKEFAIRKFRKKYLKVSRLRFGNNKYLHKAASSYDGVICGSDQVWNPFFTMGSEKTPNLSYFLNFIHDSKIKISYATSFGVNEIPPEMINQIKPCLLKFRAIGVRERTGKNIIESLGLNAQVVLDPTMLLTGNDYKCFIKKSLKSYDVFSYILHKNQVTANLIKNYIVNTYFTKKSGVLYDNEPISIEKWLTGIRESKIVITNSFHGMVFSILFHKKFIVVPVENSGMNDRITTLLSTLGLQDRMISNFNEKEIDLIYKKEINWEFVEEKISVIRKESLEFLLLNLSSNEM